MTTIEAPLPQPLPAVPPCAAGKVLVFNGARSHSFTDMYGNEIKPGAYAWLNEAHANALGLMHPRWQRVDGY